MSWTVNWEKFAHNSENFGMIFFFSICENLKGENIAQINFLDLTNFNSENVQRVIGF